LTGISTAAAVLLGRAVAQLVSNGPANAQAFAPNWLPLAAAFAAAGIVRIVYLGGAVLNWKTLQTRARRA